MVTLYSTGCPRCSVLKKKLTDAGVQYKEVTDVNEMLDRGISHAPQLLVDGDLLDFSEAIKWLRLRGGGAK